MSEFADLLRKIEDKSAIVAVAGLGTVGTEMARLVAKKGYRVIGHDKDEKRSDSGTEGKSKGGEAMMEKDAEFEPRVSEKPLAGKTYLEEWGPEWIHLRNSEGEVCDTSLQVYVKQGSMNQPIAELEFVTEGSVHAFLNFGLKELRQLAAFLNDCADRLAYYEDHSI